MIQEEPKTGDLAELKEPESEFNISVSDLLANPGSSKRIQSKAHLGKIATTLAQVPRGTVELDAEISAQANAVFAEGSLKAKWLGECRRCLEPVNGLLDIHLKECFQSDFIEGETYPIIDEAIDLAVVTKEAILLALPLAPLCDQSCKGPLPEIFIDEVSPKASDSVQRDSRWDALDSFQADKEKTD